MAPGGDGVPGDHRDESPWFVRCPGLRCPQSVPTAVTSPVSVLGLGRTVPPGAPSVNQESEAETSHKAWTVKHSSGAAQEQRKDPAACLAFPMKSQDFFLNPASLPIPLQ